MMKRLFKISIIATLIFGLILSVGSPAFAIAPSDIPIVVYGETLTDEQKEEVRRLLEISDDIEVTEYTVTGEDIARYIDGDPNSRTFSRSEEHTSELQSRGHLVCRLLLEKKNERT